MFSYWFWGVTLPSKSISHFVIWVNYHSVALLHRVSPQLEVHRAKINQKQLEFYSDNLSKLCCFVPWLQMILVAALPMKKCANSHGFLPLDATNTLLILRFNWVLTLFSKGKIRKPNYSQFREWKHTYMIIKHNMCLIVY